MRLFIVLAFLLFITDALCAPPPRLIRDNDRDTLIETDTGIFGDADEIIFTNAGGESARIDSSGNFGIGENSPSFPLHVTGTTHLDGAVVVNESSADVDMRVEGNTDINLLYCDAGNDRVGIGTNAPDYLFDVDGDFQCTSLYVGANGPYTSVTGTGAVLVTQTYVDNADATPFAGTGTDNFVPLWNGTSFLDDSAVDQTEVELLNGRTYVPDVTLGVDGNLPVFSAVNGIDDGGFSASSGAVSLATGVVTVGTLSIGNGGTNSTTALNNDFVIISSGGAIVESATVSTTELGLLNGRTSIPTNIGDLGDVDTATATPAVNDYLKYDGADWVPVALSVPAGNNISDADADTKVQTEESADEDKIRFDTGGTERMIIDNIGNVYIGPEATPTRLVMVGTAWASYTPSCTWSTNVTWYGKWRRVGDSMDIMIRGEFTGDSDAASLQCDIPSGYTIDSAKMPNSVLYRQGLGHVEVLDSGTAVFFGAIDINDSNTIAVLYFNEYAATTNTRTSAVDGSAPIATYTSNDKIGFNAKGLPITGWGVQ
jgi:hypothetical protein